MGMRRVAASVAIAAVLSSCGWDVFDDSTAESTVPPLDAAVTTAPTTTAPPTTTTLPPVDPAMVDDCIDYVQYGAFTGNPLLLAMWDEAGREVGTLRALCRDIGLNDLAVLQGMSQQWRDIEAWNAAAAASSTSSTAP